MATVRRKVFISYHHDDQREVETFVNTFDTKRDIFIARALGMEQDIIDSSDTVYVMRRIRELYLADSTVTVVLIGNCTWARRYVDWEIQASLRHGEHTVPNGLLGIVLPSAAGGPTPPERLRRNLPKSDGSDGYARWYTYPRTTANLAAYIDDAFQARTNPNRVALIINPRDRRLRSAPCETGR